MPLAYPKLDNSVKPGALVCVLTIETKVADDCDFFMSWSSLRDEDEMEDALDRLMKSGVLDKHLSSYSFLNRLSWVSVSCCFSSSLSICSLCEKHLRHGDLMSVNVLLMSLSILLMGLVGTLMELDLTDESNVTSIGVDVSSWWVESERDSTCELTELGSGMRKMSFLVG